MNTHRSPPPMLQVDRPGAACSAAPTFSRETLIAIFTSRGKSFVLRKCVLGLRLLTQREAFALSRAMTMARRLPLGADSNVAHRSRPITGARGEPAAARAYGGHRLPRRSGRRHARPGAHGNARRGEGLPWLAGSGVTQHESKSNGRVFARTSPTGMPIPGFAGRSRTGAHDCTLRGLAMVCRLYWDLQIRMPKRPSPGRKFFPLGPRNDGVKSSIDIYEESLGRSNSPCADPMLVLIYAAVDSIVVRTDSISASVDSISVTFFTADSILTLF